MTSYLIFCCPGTGGLFLTSVIAQLLGCNSNYKLSDTGHAHDMGKGNWNGNDSVCQIGYHWNFYREGFPVYYCHVLPNEFLESNQHIQTIYVDVDCQDIRKVTELYVRKAWPDIWTLDEYKKWASPEYPPYSRDNIEQNVLVQTDLINDFEHTVIRKWLTENPCIETYKKINFRTIMGIDNLNLMDEVCKMINQPHQQHVQQYIHDYQMLNQKLYFK